MRRHGLTCGGSQVTQPLGVDVPGLRALGSAVIGDGDELKRDVDAVRGQLVPGEGPGVDSWAAFVALGSAAAGWLDFLGGLSSRVQSAGQSMVKVAKAYQDVDDRAAERHGRVRYQ